MRIKRLALMIVLTGALTAPGSAGGSDQRPLLRHSIVGSSSCEGTPCFDEVMRDRAVQALLLELADGPLEVEAAAARMGPDAARVADLLTLGLIRQNGDQYRLGFALFTAADQERIRAAGELYGRSLATAVLARRTDIESALAAYDAPGVDPAAVAYFLLGCASLDWDGLALTAERGYRVTSQERPDGSYVPSAHEITGRTLERIYWGSHSAEHEGIHLTSFGDHHALPRTMLPDLLWRAPELPGSVPPPVGAAFSDLLALWLHDSGARLGRMMLALRDGERSAADLARAAGVGEREGAALLGVLASLDYVAEDGGGRYRSRVPVLTARDETMARTILAIGREVMEQWLELRHGDLRDELADLSFSRSGVPFAEGFTMIWHWVFGIANRELVAAGLFADPYAPDRRYAGAIPVVSALPLP